MQPRLEESDLAAVYGVLEAANSAFSERYPGVSLDRLPIHTLYGGAHLFKKETPGKLGRLALNHLTVYAPNFAEFARALELPCAQSLPVKPEAVDALAVSLEKQGNLTADWISATVYQRVAKKLATEAIEDQRLDFEDGYGARANEEEDSHAISAAVELADGVKENLVPPFVGIRIKSLTEETKRRSIRTLDLFLTTYAEQGVALPDPFFITLPKVTSPEHVSALLTCVELLEERCAFPKGHIKIELMIETIQSIISQNGVSSIPSLIEAGKGRVTSAILGTFDYTASCNIASHYQDHRHPSADFARQIMQVCLTGTPVNICDGITNIMPIPPNKGANLTNDQKTENLEVVHNAWREHFNNILHSLKLGFYQGWDLNPAQLPIRYAAFYYFFLEGLDDARARLSAFIQQATQASLVGNTFDDAASAQGLLNFFVNGISCGALSENEALATGITLTELHGRSFQKIVENRLRLTQ